MLCSLSYLITSATTRKILTFIMKKKRAFFTFLFLLVYGVCGAHCTPADNSTCATPSESDFNDTSDDCQVLFDLKDGPLVVRPNQSLCICAVGSKSCEDGIPVINNEHAYGDRVMITQTPQKQLLKACIAWDNVTSRDNGSFIFIRLVGPEGSRSNPLTATTELVVLDPPTHPKDLEVTILCSTSSGSGIISWTPSASADYYILNMHCGENHALKDILVDGIAYKFSYSLSLRDRCEASVYAVNLAGNSSAYPFTTVLAKDPQYTFYEYGIIINGSQAYLYLNMTGNEFCPFSYPTRLNICVDRNFPRGDTKCVVIPVNLTTSWWYQKVTQLSLLLHTYYEVNIEACNDASCKKFDKALTLSTYHIHRAGSFCYDNGSCLLFCNLTRGSRIEGCAFDFLQINNNKTLPRVYVTAGQNQEYALEPGDYTLFVFGWESGRDIFHIPAITMQISVANRGGIIIDKRVIIGVASFFGACVLLAGIVFIIVSALLYWRKHIRERQYEVEQQSEPPIALLPKKSSDADTQKDESGKGNVEHVEQIEHGGADKNGNNEMAVIVINESMGQQSEPPKALLPKEVSDADTQKDERGEGNVEHVEHVEQVERGRTDRNGVKYNDSLDDRVEVNESIDETTTRTSQCASDAPLLDSSQPSKMTPNQFRDLHGHKKVPGPPKPQVTVVVSNPPSYMYVSQTEECGGFSTKTGQPVVAPKDTANSCIHLGGGTVQSYKPTDEEEFTHVSPRNAQTPMGANSAVVTS